MNLESVQKVEQENRQPRTRPLTVQKFWRYKQYPQEVLNEVENYLTENQGYLSGLIDCQKNLQWNYEVLCEAIGMTVHPCLQNLQKEESQFPALKNSQYGSKMLQITNFKIDTVTIKILSFLLQKYRIDGIKLCRNDLQKEVSALKQLFDKNSTQKNNSVRIQTLFLQWNSLSPNPKHLFLSSVMCSLKHLSLRENNLQNGTCIEILRKIKNTNVQLKTLDLGGNHLTVEIGGPLCQFIQQDRTIQFLGLAKNKLSGGEFLKKLFSAFGEVELSDQEVNKIKENKLRVINLGLDKDAKEQEKQKTLQNYNFGCQIRQNDNGKYFLMKNTTIKVLNLAKNEIGDSCVRIFRQFTQKQGKNVQIFLQGNNFSPRSKNILQLSPNLVI